MVCACVRVSVHACVRVRPCVRACLLVCVCRGVDGGGGVFELKERNEI